MRARLLIEEGIGTPTVCILDPSQPVTLGRNRSNTIVLVDGHASREHAMVFFENGRWLIRDIGTPLNGTKLNGMRIRQPTPLEDGQEIRIGDTRLRFSFETDKYKALPTPPVVTLTDPPAQPPGLSEAVRTLLRLDELTALCTFMTASVEEADPRALIQRALQTVHQQTGATITGFLSLDAEDPLPKMVLPELARVDVHLSRHLTQRVQREGRPVWLGAQPAESPGSESLLSFKDALCLPLRVEGAALGAVHVYQCGHGFSERDLRFCEVLVEYLAKSLNLLRNRRTLEAENSRLRDHVPGGDHLIGDSPAMQQLRQLVTRVAARPSTVLITGESGVGKELVALALHRQSPRHQGPLVVVNCAAIAPSLVEAELFGYSKHAFTGADRDHPGLFEQADEGTLFLDEVGELSLDCQAKLLRVIEAKSFRPVGATAEVRVDVRILAATNRDLESEVKAGRFREDLYFRLRVIHIPVPPLREHAEDLPALVRHFLDKLAVECRHLVQLTPAALARLQAYAWPGNVRQLRAVLESAVVMSESNTLDAADLPLPAATSAQQPPTLNLEELEAWAIRQALRQTGGNITQAAKLLGVVRDTLASKMKKYGVSRDDGVTA
jgi:DNA-binding NtrC family response regulator/pSer/pThr/pTyr-binding forkhead associated (FHA) protein